MCFCDMSGILIMTDLMIVTWLIVMSPVVSFMYVIPAASFNA